MMTMTAMTQPAPRPPQTQTSGYPPMPPRHVVTAGTSSSSSVPADHASQHGIAHPPSSSSSATMMATTQPYTSQSRPISTQSVLALPTQPYSTQGATAAAAKHVGASRVHEMLPPPPRNNIGSGNNTYGGIGYMTQTATTITQRPPAVTTGANAAYTTSTGNQIVKNDFKPTKSTWNDHSNTNGKSMQTKSTSSSSSGSSGITGVVSFDTIEMSAEELAAIEAMEAVMMSQLPPPPSHISLPLITPLQQLQPVGAPTNAIRPPYQPPPSTQQHHATSPSTRWQYRQLAVNHLCE